MSPALAPSANFKVAQGSVRFFDTEVIKAQDGTLTAVFHTSSGALSPAEPVNDSVVLAIESRFARLAEIGNGAQIAQLVLSPLAACILYQHGFLTEELLVQADGGANEHDNGWIVVVSVDIMGRNVLVQINQYTRNAVIVADSAGNELMLS